MKIVKTDFKYAYSDTFFISKMNIFQLLAEMTIMNSSVLPIVKRETHIDHYSRLNPISSIKNATTHEGWLTCIEFYTNFHEIDEGGYIRILTTNVYNANRYF
ncbi:g054 [Yersinia phage phiR1-37]|uniref:hypothetical protein n=1 Tax=Yersinia phage phiR1-37 TaxID=331278 RepID=UPI00022DBCE2|nr:hypothetical protein phiR1-37_gp054 [Yersinia phage phiR1-37]CCE26078.1 g054 [Yersinia phage phiR1-37]